MNYPRVNVASRPIARCSFSALIAVLCILISAGCGSDDGVTHVDGISATITKPMLNHWMHAVVATDYRVTIGTKGPSGLAAEPANYEECASVAKKLVPRDSAGKPRLTDAEISQKCHLLYRVIKAQAIGYLLSFQWSSLEAKELGVSLTQAELHKEFLRFYKETYKTDAQFRAYMSERRLVLSDILAQLRRNILSARIQPKFEAEVKKAGGGERVLAKLALQRIGRLVAKTSCKAGYVMSDCKEYRTPAKPLPAPNAIIEGFVHAEKT